MIWPTQHRPSRKKSNAQLYAAGCKLHPYSPYEEDFVPTFTYIPKYWHTHSLHSEEDFVWRTTFPAWGHINPYEWYARSKYHTEFRRNPRSHSCYYFQFYKYRRRAPTTVCRPRTFLTRRTKKNARFFTLCFFGEGRCCCRTSRVRASNTERAPYSPGHREVYATRAAWRITYRKRVNIAWPSCCLHTIHIYVPGT